MIKNKTFYIETYGCQMNFSDSEIVASVLKDNNFELVNSYEDADVIFINTCSIRENAETKVFNRLKHLNHYKRKKQGVIVGLLGCMAERLKEQLFSDGIVDLIAGPDSYRQLPELLKTTSNKEKAFQIVLSEEETYADIKPVKIDSNGVSAFISIMRGCQNFCSYCVVPFTRGKERSRAPHTIINEAKELFENGFREITLLGQNVNSYQHEGIRFHQLISMVAEINPLLRVRFATSHPKDISDELIDSLATHGNICKYIHLPVQSGSNNVLKSMNRKYTREFYLERVSSILKKIPDCGISTDIIAGFCGETENDHLKTLSLMKKVKFDSAFMFQYSERSGTTAAKNLADDVPEDVKSRRLNEIIHLQQQISLDNNKKDIGRTFEVLIEGRSKRSARQLSGRNSQNKMVVFNDDVHKPGDYVNVIITDCTSATLKGKLIS